MRRRGTKPIVIAGGNHCHGDGQPIAGATILLYPSGWERPSFERDDGTSDLDGSFQANWGLAVGVDFFRMVVSNPGYREHERLVEADATGLRIVMERVSNADDGADLESPRLTKPD